MAIPTVMCSADKNVMLYWSSGRVTVIKSAPAISHAPESISWSSISVMLDIHLIGNVESDHISDLAPLKSMVVPIIGALRESHGSPPSPAFLVRQCIINAECIIRGTDLAL